MSCVLRFTGDNFDVDGFLEHTGLQPYLKFKKGDPIWNGKNQYTYNGCSFDLSEDDFENLQKQIEEAIKFLKENFDKLRMAYDFNLIEEDGQEIDFGINLRASEVVVMQTDSFPPELLRLAGQLGCSITLSQYNTFSEDDEEDVSL